MSNEANKEYLDWLDRVIHQGDEIKPRIFAGLLRGAMNKTNPFKFQREIAGRFGVDDPVMIRFWAEGQVLPPTEKFREILQAVYDYVNETPASS